MSRARPKIPKAVSHLEATLALHLRIASQGSGIEPPEREYRFAMLHVGKGPALRKRLQEVGLKDWRFDFAWPSIKFAVEVEGGARVYGRHNRPQGFADDLQKYHHAMAMGWTIYRCDAALINSGKAVNYVEGYLQCHSCLS